MTRIVAFGIVRGNDAFTWIPARVLLGSGWGIFMMSQAGLGENGGDAPYRLGGVMRGEEISELDRFAWRFLCCGA